MYYLPLTNRTLSNDDVKHISLQLIAIVLIFLQRDSLGYA
jgi:hypothetical protein